MTLSVVAARKNYSSFMLYSGWHSNLNILTSLQENK